MDKLRAYKLIYLHFDMWTNGGLTMALEDANYGFYDSAIIWNDCHEENRIVKGNKKE